MKKKSKVPVIVTCSLVACVALGVGGYFIGRNFVKKEETPTTMVKLDVNPSISLTLDENNYCISVTGENNEGKMILNGENYIGKTLDSVIKSIIETEEKTGYLISGDLTIDTNTISFSVSCEDAGLKSSIEGEIKESIEEICTSLNIEENIKVLDGYTKEALISYILTFDTTRTKEELQNLSYEELIEIITKHNIETFELYTVELEEFYNEAKNYQIDFVSKEETQKVISSIGTAYATIINASSAITSSLKEAINSLNETRYSLFINEDSVYQNYMNQFKELKSEVIDLRNSVAEIDTADPSRDAYLETLDIKIKALEECEALLEKTKNECNATLETLINTANTALDSIDAIIASLPDQATVESVLNQNAAEIQAKINEEKNNFFNNFEEAYKEIIEKSKNEAASYKAQLIAQNK